MIDFWIIEDEPTLKFVYEDSDSEVCTKNAIPTTKKTQSHN